MEYGKGWLMSVLAASFLVAVARSVMPEGAVKSVGSLVCGLALFWVVAQPLVGFSAGSLARQVRDYRQELEQTQAALAGTGEKLTRSIIARETAAYIQDKRTELGLDCQAEVSWDWSGQVPVPDRVTVTGPLTQAEREKLTEALTRDLGLTEEGIIYLEEDETP